ncbi:hypothetical protein CXF72_00700 [Psychromonas sp. MB-3u-54]|uniref:DUF2913 family protein n=1 Tax=Psychromonas sp. MB-3u-54 TaxID=2058319 RepID=UPI000C325144|nr:DUF2913 family protein [Psychromonas sp. MB-3u-54]PKH04436.1 hypothetical protein CXF72_00700 [Psychromonas sp. MB-3u-54]
MIQFSTEIYKLITTALTELSDSHDSGRTPHNPLSEAHYLGAWVTTAMKKKRFDAIVAPTLQTWQRQARSLGKNAGLKRQFTHLEKCYSKVFDEQKEVRPVNKSQLEKLFAMLEEDQWLVTTDLPVGERLNRHSGGKESLIVCTQQLLDCFDQQGMLIKPISLYIRGTLQSVIDLAFAQDLLLHKITDYKSKVKYHGEFVVYPNNDGKSLPEFPENNSEKS